MGNAYASAARRSRDFEHHLPEPRDTEEKYKAGEFRHLHACFVKNLSLIISYFIVIIDMQLLPKSNASRRLSACAPRVPRILALTIATEEKSV